MVRISQAVLNSIHPVKVDSAKEETKEKPKKEKPKGE